jgi:hypothetical protein
METASLLHCSRTPLLRKHRTSWQKHFGGTFLALTLTLLAQAASAQLVGSRSVQGTNCATAVGGDVRDTTITTVCGMPSEQVVELVRLAASPQAGDRAELMARLGALVPASSQLRVEAIAKFFQLLGQAPVEESELANRFAQIAVEHRRLTRWRYITAEASANGTLGDQRGNNPALARAIASYRAALRLVSRTERPLDWAMTQNGLGLALSTLGERESGTAKLEEAVAAYGEALQEWTRERTPLRRGHGADDYR